MGESDRTHFGGRVFWIGLACWLVGLAWHWWRPWLGFVDGLVGMVAASVYVLGFVAVVAAVVNGRRWVLLATLVPALVVVMAVVNSMWVVAPRMWFNTHRSLFETAAAADFRPVQLRFLTADGRVEIDGSTKYFPQHLGLPDEMGGYMYSPDADPTSSEFYGFFCRTPIPLGGDWWMCGMPDYWR
ncbi:MAG TPA: hypothetical protein VF477_06300 [Mycobacterium sp.]